MRNNCYDHNRSRLRCRRDAAEPVGENLPGRACRALLAPGLYRLWRTRRTYCHDAAGGRPTTEMDERRALCRFDWRDQSDPRSSSTELAIYLGYLRAGWPGLLIAGICFIGPAMLIVLAIAWAYVTYG